MKEEKKTELNEELINQAIKVIKDNNVASTTILYRKLQISRALADKLINYLEDVGFIGPAIGAKKREIYIKDSQNF